jgi:hypothetical protein
MNLLNRFQSIFLLLLFLLASCATQSQIQNVDHALYLCRQLAGPDADKGNGEVWFGLQSELAKTSKKLWNKSGESEIGRRLSMANSDVDRMCLIRLKKEAGERQIESDH